MSTTSIVLLGFVAAATSQFIPRICVAPEQWEGNTSVYNYNLNVHDLGRVTYDAELEQIREDEESNADLIGRKFFTRYFFYKTREMYTVTQSGSNPVCTKAAIPAEKKWRPFGVPKNASFTQLVNIGAPGDSITASEFVMLARKSVDNPEGIYYRGVWSKTECVPVYEQMEKKFGDLAHSENIFYSDITLGISNPNVFILPRECSPENVLVDNTTFVEPKHTVRLGF